MITFVSRATHQIDDSEILLQTVNASLLNIQNCSLSTAIISAFSAFG